MCPQCGSSYLKIKKQTALERVMIYLTGKRKYWCHDCFFVFRAVDRRRHLRPSGNQRSESPARGVGLRPCVAQSAVLARER